MGNSSTSTLIGWTLSFILYIVILSFGIYTLQVHHQKVIKYTASKKNLLNVTLVERKNKKVVKKKKQKVVKKKTTISKPKKKVTPSKPKQSPKKTVRVKKAASKPDLKSLFKNLKVEKIPEQKQTRQKRVRKKIVQKKIEEVVKDNKAKKITKQLEFEQQENLIITQKDGQYDELRGKISDILDQHWQETIDTVSGNEAKVIVGIDKLGKFSYKIETLSYNDVFNAKLRDFLEEMRDVEFPPFEGDGVFQMKAIFKDILER